MLPYPVIFIGAAGLPALGYSTHGITGLLIGFVFSFLIQYMTMRMYIRSLAKKGTVSFASMYTLIMLTILVGAVALAYSAYRKSSSISSLIYGLISGAILSLLIQAGAIKLADKTIA